MGSIGKRRTKTNKGQNPTSSRTSSEVPSVERHPTGLRFTPPSPAALHISNCSLFQAARERQEVGCCLYPCTCMQPRTVACRLIKAHLPALYFVVCWSDFDTCAVLHSPTPSPPGTQYLAGIFRAPGFGQLPVASCFASSASLHQGAVIKRHGGFAAMDLRFFIP